MSRVPLLTLGILGLCFAAVSLAHVPRAHARKHKQHKFVGKHPLSARADDGYCYIEVPHVHGEAIPKKHRTLYREHRGYHHFVADPKPYHYEGQTHAYYGHHPIAVDVVLGEVPRYETGQPLEFCYLDGPHRHAFAPPPGLTFEAKGGVLWYIGEFPDAYVEGRPRYTPVNEVYATVKIEPPVVEIDAPPSGYLGPVLTIHAHVGDPEPVRPRPTRHGHVEGHVDVGLRVSLPSVHVGVGLPGVVVDGHHHKRVRHHREHKKSRGRHHRGRGHKSRR